MNMRILKMGMKVITRSKENEVASKLVAETIDLTCDDDNFDIPLRERLERKRRKMKIT